MFCFRRTFLLVGTAFVLLTTSGHAGLWDSVKSLFSSSSKDKSPTIRVLLAHRKESIDLDVRGGCRVRDPYKKSRLSTHFASKRRIIRANPATSSIEWGQEYVDCHQVEIIPDSRNTAVIVDGVEYRGKLYVYEIKGKISIVNEVEIEEYLSSTLAPIQEQNLPDEAVAATCIAARTNAYFQANHSTNPYWHVRAEDVNYSGHRSMDNRAPISRALASSRNMVMSQTGMYERKLTPFPIAITNGSSTQKTGGRTPTFSLDEGRDLAVKGDNAAQILARTFPNTSIQLLNFDRPAAPKLAEYSSPQPRPRRSAVR